MPKASITDEEIVRMTMENVRSFYSRDKAITTEPMAENFVFIGANDFQWCEGCAEFRRITDTEYEEPPVVITDEEFHVLFHERNVWVLYGRYKATAVLADGSVMHAHVRGSYVWRRIGGEMKLCHVHGSHAQDIPLKSDRPALPISEDTHYFEYLREINSLNTSMEKLDFREAGRSHRYLFPDEIVYLRAAAGHTEIYTAKDCFCIPGILSKHEEKLPPQFMRIQKSHTVNLKYVDTVCRYKAALKDGRVLPIGKDWYMDVKRRLQGLEEN